MTTKLKICGMKLNVAEVAALHPDYLGFIFYEKSIRNFEDEKLTVSDSIKRVGVFVDAPISFVMKKVKKYKLDVIQLHGDESVFFINEINQNIFNLSINLKSKNDHSILSTSTSLSRTAVELPVLSGVEVWKVFSVDTDFDFGNITKYENVVDKFLFDTKGKGKGGNGFAFDWSILKEYPSTKPFILSGGVSMENISEVKELLKTDLPIYGIDVNSKFEDSPGFKNISELKKLIKELE